jgi:hypothetical protein
MLPVSPSNAPALLGLIIAGAGLALLSVSLLVPRISIESENDDEFGIYGLSSLSGTGTLAIDTATVFLCLALLIAVGLSAHPNTSLRWPSRLSAVGLAALTAAVSYHPITVLQQYVDMYSSQESSGGYSDSGETIDYTIEADTGVYLVFAGVALLAVSAFLMQRRRLQPLPVPPAPVSPGADPTITVNPA